jgi:hypothetical protein
MARTIATVTGPKGSATVRHDREWGEYVVTFHGNARAGYHTDDREDAIGTARVGCGLTAREEV